MGGEGFCDVNVNDSEVEYFATWFGGIRDSAFGTLDVTVTAYRPSTRFVPVRGHTFTDVFTVARS